MYQLVLRFYVAGLISNKNYENIDYIDNFDNNNNNNHEKSFLGI
jgi:hypothetical protein